MENVSQKENTDLSKINSQNITIDEKQTIHIVFRHLFLVMCILLALIILTFLVYKNGESIYVKGI